MVAGGCDFPHRRVIVPACDPERGNRARQGVGVVIASRGKAAATAALKELAGAGDATWQPVDVADGKSVARLIATAMGEHGRLDYAFNSGGSGYLTSVFLCMSAEIAAMKRSGASVIVNNASVDGLRGYPFPGGAAYSAAKHGVIGLTRSAALEHAVQDPASAPSVRDG
jgi:NAD(P)-dependent dehydrogenase (short-subunit alcohol dehydrogenase family)